MFDLITKNLLWSEGLGMLIVLGILGAGALFFFRPLFYLIVLLFLFSLFFFRNPKRICAQALHDDTVIVCPADGKIVDIQEGAENKLEGFAHKISIFLSLFDAHVIWIPIAGVVEEIVYKPGTFSFAFLPKSSEYNERNDLFLKNKDGRKIKVRQIAGMIARRISCWAHKGQNVEIGQPYGMIKFGSRVDLFLPQDVEISVNKGQRVYGGQTVLGRLLCHS